MVSYISVGFVGSIYYMLLLFFWLYLLHIASVALALFTTSSVTVTWSLAMKLSHTVVAA